MRRIYSFFLYLLLPLFILRLLLKSRKNPAYRKRVLERFGLVLNSPMVVDVWLHAVSLGEVVAATPLIEALLIENKRVLVTTMTPSGSKQVLDKFHGRVIHQYLPYDFPWSVKRFFRKLDVKVGIMMETEIWPNLIYYANLHNLKLCLVNGRISDKAIVQYKRIGKIFFASILNKFAFIGVQSEIDAQRFMDLGADAAIVSVLGNIKFDLINSFANLKDFSTLKQAWGERRVVLIAASTHDNEEHELLIRLKKLKKSIPDIILLIAPRHSERFKGVYELSRKLGFKTFCRSRWEEVTKDSDVIVLDSMGELLSFFQLSDFAFIGGSLVPIGGHNVLEPIAMGIPVFCGPYMQNSKDICKELQVKDAIGFSQDADDLCEKIIASFEKPKQRLIQIANANAVLEANKGALGRYLEKIKKIS